MRIQIIRKSFFTLTSRPSTHILRNFMPITRTLHFHEGEKKLIFFFFPFSFLKTRSYNFIVTLHTLRVISRFYVYFISLKSSWNHHEIIIKNSISFQFILIINIHRAMSIQFPSPWMFTASRKRSSSSGLQALGGRGVLVVGLLNKMTTRERGDGWDKWMITFGRESLLHPQWQSPPFWVDWHDEVPSSDQFIIDYHHWPSSSLSLTIIIIIIIDYHHHHYHHWLSSLTIIIIIIDYHYHHYHHWLSLSFIIIIITRDELLGELQGDEKGEEP